MTFRVDRKSNRFAEGTLFDFQSILPNGTDKYLNTILKLNYRNNRAGAVKLALLCRLRVPVRFIISLDTGDQMKHIFRMIFGYFLYFLTFKLFDLQLDNRFFMWALPHIGYQGYHPEDLKWWQRDKSI